MELLFLLIGNVIGVICGVMFVKYKFKQEEAGTLYVTKTVDGAELYAELNTTPEQLFYANQVKFNVVKVIPREKHGL